MTAPRRRGDRALLFPGSPRLHSGKDGEETLRRAALVISEVSVQKRFAGSYTFQGLVGFMNERGFRVAEVLEAPPNAEGRIMYVDIAFLPR